MSVIQKIARGKQVAINHEPTEGVVVKEIAATKKDKIYAKAMTAGFTILTPALCFVIAPDSLLNAQSLIPQVIGCLTAVSGVLGVIISRAFLWDASRDNVATAMVSNSTGHDIYNMGKFMDKSKKGRILVHSFHIREESDINVDSWQDVSKATIVENATHTVNQYMVKVKGKYRLEQEVAANAETIWDISADALVEVYKVREKTESKERVQA